MDSVYRLIQQDLVKIEENLKALSNVDLPWVPQLLEYVFNVGGKRIRPVLTLLVGQCYHSKLSSLLPMATAVELLHAATLVHDDTVDNSPTRRGRPTVNSLWGDGRAVLLGDYLFSTAADLVCVTKNIRVIRLFAQTLMAVSSGELRQTFSAYDPEQSRHHYYQRIASKTAALFTLATESGAILSQASEDMIQSFQDYGYNLGTAFQIVDDILDFVGEEDKLGKPIGSDLIQGTLTLPAILLMERYPRDNTIKRVFETRDQESLKQALEMISDPSLINECYDVAKSFCSQACQALSNLPDSAHHRALLNIANYVVERHK